MLGLLACRLGGVDPHPGELLAAVIVCLVSVEAAVLPLVRYRGAEPQTLFQIGFAGTVVHLVLAALLGAAAIFGLRTSNAFAYWLLGLYWLSLLGLCWAIVKRTQACQSTAARESMADPETVLGSRTH